MKLTKFFFLVFIGMALLIACADNFEITPQDTTQFDTDTDGVIDDIDNCPTVANADQADADGDGIGDACDISDEDNDNDGIVNDADNCPDEANPEQEDVDFDGIGDVCDPEENVDNDGDGVDNVDDNCIDTPNPDQEDADDDGVGDACEEADSDADGIPDSEDNCPTIANEDQADADQDGVGDACADEDTDGDTIVDGDDNCINTENTGQADEDGDLVGDVCDNCLETANADQVNSDTDEFGDACDNCPEVDNPDQADADADGIGDACEDGGTTAQLIITGIVDGPLSGGVPKAVEIYVAQDVADLSVYGLGSANNGGGSGGVEFTFPADGATAGEFIYVASEETGFTDFFGFAPNYIGDAANVNGDDAIELYLSTDVIDTFGNINGVAANEGWEYTDGWSYRTNGTGPDGITFVPDSWTFSGTDIWGTATTNDAATDPFPVGTYTP